jgi:hypothetical protein
VLSRKHICIFSEQLADLEVHRFRQIGTDKNFVDIERHLGDFLRPVNFQPRPQGLFPDVALQLLRLRSPMLVQTDVEIIHSRDAEQNIATERELAWQYCHQCRDFPDGSGHEQD